MAAEGNLVAPEVDIASRSAVLLEGTLAKLGACTSKGCCFEVRVTTSNTFASRLGA